MRPVCPYTFFLVLFINLYLMDAVCVLFVEVVGVFRM